MTRPAADPVAVWIAQIIRGHLVGSPAEQQPDLAALPEGVTGAEAHPIGELDVGITVTTDRGIRYFLVRVIEFNTR